ncbi:hypothetical protein [Halomonas stenophila]|uniref:Uncharacterized protein n=1 Tax=Halomonas stenophila TaxID=795312 RepID=A0A7W5HMU9_9GAMM|nr:hypothetical protein [Halomonas stenophila]MBB3233009.1 hypothetical protein [Halomonas stenophila]
MRRLRRWVTGVGLLLVMLLGSSLGVDLRRPALKLPGTGRLGMAEAPRAGGE